MKIEGVAVLGLSIFCSLFVVGQVEAQKVNSKGEYVVKEFTYRYNNNNAVKYDYTYYIEYKDSTYDDISEVKMDFGDKLWVMKSGNDNGRRYGLTFHYYKKRKNGKTTYVEYGAPDAIVFNSDGRLYSVTSFYEDGKVFYVKKLKYEDNNIPHPTVCSVKCWDENGNIDKVSTFDYNLTWTESGNLLGYHGERIMEYNTKFRRRNKFYYTRYLNKSNLDFNKLLYPGSLWYVDEALFCFAGKKSTNFFKCDYQSFFWKATGRFYYDFEFNENGAVTKIYGIIADSYNVEEGEEPKGVTKILEIDVKYVE